MVKIGINIYSLRELDEPMLDVIDRVADEDYDGIQFGGFGDATAEEVRDKLDERGLEAVPAAHVGFTDLQNDLGDLQGTHQGTMSCPRAVLSYLDESYFADESTVEETVSKVTALTRKVTEAGWDLHYHNHDQELITLGEETALDRLLRRADGLGLEPDVGWLHTGGADPVSIIERYADRIDVVHMKDMANGEFREIGDGEVDMTACATAARAADASWLVYEHDQPEDPTASIEAGAEFLADV